MTYEEARSQPLPDWPEWMSPEVAARYLRTAVRKSATVAAG
ncbi:hypothetical protein [Roseovarius sp. MBR-6]|jgi:hypothetical protein